MSPDARPYMIKYHLDQADSCIAEAQALFDKELYRGAINRAYYAMFYGVSALMKHKGVSAAKHSGAIAMFDLHFVKAGVFNRDDSKRLHEAFELRMSVDYGELAPPDRETASRTLNHAVDFVGRVKAYLESQNAG